MIKGIVTIQKRNKDTLELIEEREVENIITQRGYHYLYGSNIGGRTRIYITEQAVTNDLKVVSYAGVSGNGEFFTNLTTGTVLAGFPLWTAGTPNKIEMSERYQPPATVTRNVNSIYLGDNDECLGYVGLLTPCTQTTTEILDVVYRLEFSADLTNNTPNKYTNFDLSTLEAEGSFSAPSEEKGRIDNFNRLWINSDKIASKYNFLVHGEGSSTVPTTYTTITSDFLLDYAQTATFSFSETQHLGQLFGSFLAYSNSFNSTNRWYTYFVEKSISPTFANAPIQPIHNHNSAAISPFLDVDFLATGTGTVNMDGTSWTDPNFPKLYRTEIVKSGAIGVSEYYIKSRNMFGFTGANYEEKIEYLPWIYGGGSSNIINNLDTITDLHIISSNITDDGPSHVEEYDDTKIMMWNLTGVTILDVVTGEYVNLDNTTLTIPFENINQCDVDTSGNVWIADSTTGLYKISSPFSSPTSLKFTVALHSIPGDNACFGVSVGNNAVFAMFDGGLSKSVDGGTTWINYNSGTTPKFEYVGITDANWSNVKMIRANRNDTLNDNIGIIRLLPATDNVEVVFWKISLELTKFINILYDMLNGVYPTIKFRCSRKSNLWTYIGDSLEGTARINQWQYDPKNMISHSISATVLDSNGIRVMGQFNSRGASYLTNNLENTYMLVRNNNTDMILVDKFFNDFDSLDQGDISSEVALYFENPNTKNIGFRLYIQNQNRIGLPDKQGTNTPLLGGAMEHCIWVNKGWNGSAWVDNFLIDMPDSSANSNVGTRKGMIPGTTTFNRFSYITNASISSNFLIGDSSMTFATNASSTYSGTSKQADNILFSINNNGKYLGLISKINADIEKQDDEFGLIFGTWVSKLGSALTSSNDRYAITFDRIASSGNTYTAGNIVPSTLASNSWFVNATGSITINDGTNSFILKDFHQRNFLSADYRNGVNIFTGEIPHLINNDFKVLFKRNQILQSWRGTTPSASTEGRFILRVDFDKTSRSIQTNIAASEPTNVEDFYAMHDTNKFIEISLRHTFNNTPVLVTPTTYGQDNARVYTNFTVTNQTVADDFNGTNELAVKFVHNGTSYDITITSDNGATETTLYTATCPINIAADQTGRIMWHLTTGGHLDSKTSTTQYNAEEEILDFKVVKLDDLGLVNQVAITEVATHKNGALLGTVYTEDIDYANITSLTLGNNTKEQYDDYMHGYEGSLDNIQLWKGKWNGTDITNDAAAPTAVITPGGGATLQLRYTNLVADVSSEIKVTHTASAAIDDGLTNSFTAGTSGTDFVATDYYTNGVYDGVWKDDAIAFSGHFNYYYKPITYGFTDVESHTAPNITPVVIPSTTTNVTEKVFFTRIGSQLITVPGQLSSVNADNYDAADSCTGFQELTGNGYLEFTLRSIPVNAGSVGTMIGLSDNVPGSYVNMDYGIYIIQNIIRVYENGTNIGTFGVNYARDDVYRITRTGTTIEYRQNSNLIYTSLIPSSTNLWFFMSGDGNAREVFSDIVMNYDKPANMIDIGNSVTLTGKYDADFLLCLEEEDLYTITINAVPATVITVEETANFTEMTSPGVNEVVINRLAGVAKFNPADVGKTITISAPIMKYQ